MLLEEGRDADGRRVLPEGLLHDELCCLIPSTVGRALRVGIRKEDDLMTTQWPELVCLYVTQACGGLPDTLGVQLREDNG